MVIDVNMAVQSELNSLPMDSSVLDKVKAVFVGITKKSFHFKIQVARFVYDWDYEEVEEGQRLVAQISDCNKYYTFITLLYTHLHFITITLTLAGSVTGGSGCEAVS